MDIGEIIAAIVVPVKTIIITIVIAYFKSKKTKSAHSAESKQDIKHLTEMFLIYVENNGVDPKVKKIIIDKHKRHKESKLHNEIKSN